MLVGDFFLNLYLTPSCHARRFENHVFSVDHWQMWISISKKIEINLTQSVLLLGTILNFIYLTEESETNAITDRTVRRQSYLNFLSWLSSRWSYWTFPKLPGSRTNSMLSLRTIPINRRRTRVLRKRLEVNLSGRSWRQYRLRNFRNYLKLSLPFFLSVRNLLLLAIRLIYSCKGRFFTKYRTDLHYMPEIQACSMLLDDIIFTRVLL